MPLKVPFCAPACNHRLRAVLALALLLVSVPGVARAAVPASLPAAAQDHAYRHGTVPTRTARATGINAATGTSTAMSSSNLSYGGAIGGIGVTTGAPKVYIVFWGSQWGTQGTDSHNNVTLSGDPKSMAPYLQAFLKGIGTGGETWSGVMTQYCQGVSSGATSCPSSNAQHVGYPTGGALAGVWVDESAAAPAQASGDQLGTEAVAAAAHFGNGTAASNRNAQYVIVSPTGTTPDGFNTPSGNFCAWHDYTGDSGLGTISSPAGPLAFTNLPYITDAGASCGENAVNAGSAGTLDGVSIVEGHEYAETITDQFPAGGWTDSSGNENGDKCAWISTGQGAMQNITLTTGKFAVQSTWANDFNGGSGGCEVSHAVVTDPNLVTVANPGSQSTLVGQAVSLQTNASDSDSSQTLAYSASGLPTGLSMSSTGLITGTPSAVGNNTVTVTATDSTGASGNASFTWAVTARSSATSLSCTPASVTSGSATTCTATVSDTSGGAPVTPTSSVSFNASPTSAGQFSGGGACALLATGTTGVASCQVTYTPSAAGSQTIAAGYGGDKLHSGSASGVAALSVSAPPPPPASSGGTSTGGSSTGTSGSTASTASTASTGSAGPSTSSGSGSGSGLPGSPVVTASPACPEATGALSGSTLGLVRLGMTRQQARSAYARSRLTSRPHQDIFCMTPSGVRVGYATWRQLKTLRAGRSAALAGRVVWVTTSNARYATNGVHPGASLAKAKGLLRGAKKVASGRNDWYLIRSRASTLLIEVRGGVVREVGVASNLLTGSRRSTLSLVAALA